MNADELFSAMGMIEEGDALVYRYTAGGDTFDIRVHDTATMGRPDASTVCWTAVDARKHPSTLGKGYDVVLVAYDPRDVMALCFASEHSLRFGIMGEQPDEEMGFEWEGTFITNPFADEIYADWKGSLREDWPSNIDGRACVLTPATQRDWADPYVSWRDGLAERIVARAAAPKP